MDFKKLVPDFNALKNVNWAKPEVDTKNTLGMAGLVAAALMVVFVFLPWIGITVNFFIAEISASSLGITTWYGILGFIFGLVAVAGALYKQHALAFCASACGVLMGILGLVCYASITYEGVTMTADEVKLAAEAGADVNRIGAILYLVAALGSAAVAYLTISKKEE